MAPLAAEVPALSPQLHALSAVGVLINFSYGLGFARPTDERGPWDSYGFE